MWRKRWPSRASAGYPLILKAAAGGGGRGMRVVRNADDMARLLQSCQNEARGAFGSDEIFIERFVERPKHIEFQILADEHGNVIHLFERDCSIQRRHQKLIEEAPSPALTPELRAEMGDVAVRVAKAANYTNAGTVEFLLDEQGRYYFMEMNTRLQVEHPVTEMVTFIDLVRAQIHIATGEPLHRKQEDVQIARLVHRGADQRRGPAARLHPRAWARSTATSPPRAAACGWTAAPTRATPSRRNTTAWWPS